MMKEQRLRIGMKKKLDNMVKERNKLSSKVLKLEGIIFKIRVSDTKRKSKDDVVYVH